MPDILEGGCLCGEVRYRIEVPVLYTDHCHCRMCQLGTGAPVMTWVAIEHKGLAFTTSSVPISYRSSAFGTRTFCRTCGTKLTFTHKDSEGLVDVTVGSLDELSQISVDSHVCTQSRIDWLTVDPHLPSCNYPWTEVQTPRAPTSDSGIAEDRHEGGCLCGSVRYAVTGPPVKSAMCYCGICRKATGGVLTAWGIWRTERFEHLSGRTTAYDTSETGRRRFCGVCGSTVYFESKRNPNIAEIMLSQLDNPGLFQPDAHQFAADAPEWLTTGDDRPRFAGKLGGNTPNDALLRPGF